MAHLANASAPPKYQSLIPAQNIHTLATFTLESGVVLEDVPIAYKTWGKLNDTRDNVMVICHAFTGSADVEDWWGPLMGVGKAFDPSRFFIFCANVMGSPYGSASPVTINPHTGLPYGPEFPLTTIRDDVKAHKMVLDSLGVRSVAVVVGGSMGGMAVLEWPLCHPQGYVRHIIPLATSARHSAWCISWSEAQRQSIYSDPNFQDGYYTPESQPKSGLAAARMAALLTYRSRDSFESRFGRRPQLYRRPSPSVNGNRNWNGNGVSNSLCVQKGGRNGSLLTPPASPAAKSIKALVAHNEGNRNSLTSTLPGHSEEASANPGDTAPPTTTIFSAQSYLRYQGDKFTARFDANCYIHITRKMDTHDVSRDRLLAEEDGRHERALARILSTLPKGALVIGVETDGLFTPNEQEELAAHIPNAELVMIQSKDGHDGFLLEFEEINRHVLAFLHRELPEIYMGSIELDNGETEDFVVTRTSTFGEAEVDVAMW